MQRIEMLKYARRVVDTLPAVKAYLSDESLAAIEYIKTYDYFLGRVSGLVRRAHGGEVGTVEFSNAMSELINGQMRNAYNTAWFDSDLGGETSAQLPDYLEESLSNFIASQSNMQWSYMYYADIQKARAGMGTLDSLISRASLWATRWNEAYSEAMKLITMRAGGRLMWVEGDTEDKCEVCKSLDGIVAYASLWDELNVRPQHAPNNKLQCGGWKCGCYFLPTNKRQTKDAKKKILLAVKRAS